MSEATKKYDQMMAFINNGDLNEAWEISKQLQETPNKELWMNDDPIRTSHTLESIHYLLSISTLTPTD